MDFQTAPCVIEALEKMSAHGIYGYSDVEEDYSNALKNWMFRRHQYVIEKEWLLITPGIVFALAMAVQAYTKEGESVFIQEPVYYPFKEVILHNQRKVVINNLFQDHAGIYQMNLEEFEAQIIKEKVKLFILCSPHNPIGRVWSEAELEVVGDICSKHGVIVVSDEIHADFVFEGKHHVFSTIHKKFAEISLICTSPSKSFNMAGLQVSNIFIANKKLRDAFKDRINASGYSQPNLAGLVACQAAYEQGESWLEAVLEYLAENANYVSNYFNINIPKVKVGRLEGTYLMWLDFRAYQLTDEEIDRRIVEAGVWLDRGGMFGVAGEGFQRINIACPRKVLKEALDYIITAFT